MNEEEIRPKKLLFFAYKVYSNICWALSIHVILVCSILTGLVASSEIFNTYFDSSEVLQILESKSHRSSQLNNSFKSSEKQNRLFSTIKKYDMSFL